MILFNYRRLFFYAALALAVSGCQVLKPHGTHSLSGLPDTFNTETDSAELHEIRWQMFFPDPNLVQLIDTALARNPDVKIAWQRIEKAKAGILYSRSFLAPRVDLEVSGGAQRFGKHTMDGVGNYDTNFSPNIAPDQKMTNPLPDYFAGFRSSWEIDIWGKLKTQRKASFQRFLASEMGYKWVMTDLISQVAMHYYRLLSLDNELDIILKNIELQKSAAQTVEIQKEGGRANELAVQQFKAQLYNTQSLAGDIVQEIVVTENSLNALLGRFPQPITRGNPIGSQELPHYAKTGVPSQVLARRPDVRQAELELRAYQADLDVARLAFLPSVSITAHTALHTFSLSKMVSPASIAFSALGGITAPVFNRRALKANRKHAEAEAVEHLHHYQKTILNGFQEVLTSLKNIENLESVATFKKQEVDVLHSAITTSNDLFVAGYASYLEVLTARKNVLDAELQLNNIQTRQFLALVHLYRSLGGGWE